MASELKPLPQIDFSGGENTVSSGYVLKPNQSQQIVNMIMDEHGSLRTRDGTLIQNSQSPSPSSPIVKIFDFVKVDGTIIKLAIIQGASTNKLYVRTTNPWTLIGTFTGNYALPDMLTFTNLAITAPGNAETLRYYDGTTFGALTGAPNGAHIALHLGYLWAANTATSTGASSGPSSLQCSDINNPNSWPGTNQVFVNKDDGQSIQALTLFTIAESGISPTATIIVWKDFSGYEATGVLGTTQFAIQRIKSDMGCVAPRTVQFISGFGVIRLTHRGFALYDGVNDQLISEEERPRIFGRGNYTGLNWSSINLSYASQVPNPPLYVCACPVTGSTLTRVFIYDLVRRSWSIATYANALQTLYLPTDPNTLPVMLGGDASAGYVRRYFGGDTSDDGTPISWTLLSRPASGTSPMDRLYFRRLLAKFFNVSSGNAISATFYSGPASSATNIAQTVTITTANLSTAGWGTDAWGTIGWGSVSAASAYTDVDLNFDIGQIANNMAVLLSGTGPATLRGLEWHIRVKALTRSVYALQ